MNKLNKDPYTKKLKIVVKQQSDLSSANGKIVVTGKGIHRKVHVVLFNENQVNRILQAVDEINISD